MSDLNENLVDEQTEEITASDEAEAIVEAEAPVEAEPQNEAEPLIVEQIKKKSKAPLIIALLIAVIAAVGAVFAFLHMPKGTGAFDPVFYSDYDYLYMEDLGKAGKKPVKIVDLNEKRVYASDFRISSDNTEALFLLVEDDYSEDFENDMPENALYRYDLTTPEVAPTEIVRDIYDYVYDEATGTVTYVTSEKNVLMQIDSEGNKTELAKDVYDFKFSDDGLTLIYTTETSVFLKQADKDPVEISKDGIVEFTDDKLSVIYILEGDTSLYKVDNSGKKELIDTNVGYTLFGKADGYYFKTSEEFLLDNIFIDDMAESDNEIKIPSDKNSEAYEAYKGRIVRDEIRTALLDPETAFTINDLYYYNGSETKKVLENVIDTGYDEYYYDEAAEEKLVCSVVNREADEKILMSEIWEAYNESLEDESLSMFADVIDIIYEPILNSTEDYFVYADKCAESLKIKGLLSDITFDEKNSIIYVTIGDDYSENANLYKISYTVKGLSEPELIRKNVSPYDVHLTEEGKLLYLEDVTEAEDEYGYGYTYNAYLDSELIFENACSVYDYDFEAGYVIFEREIETKDDEFISSYDYILYDLRSGTQTELNADTIYSFYMTSAGNYLLIEENYDSEEPLTKVYLLKDGKAIDLRRSFSSPEYFDYISEIREGDASGFLWGDDIVEIF